MAHLADCDVERPGTPATLVEPLRLATAGAGGQSASRRTMAAVEELRRLRESNSRDAARVRAGLPVGTRSAPRSKRSPLLARLKQVRELAVPLLDKRSRQLGDEGALGKLGVVGPLRRRTHVLPRRRVAPPARSVWVVYEQAILACLDALPEYDGHVQRYLAALAAKFGDDSARVGRLRGMYLEAQGKYTTAASLYDGILLRDPTNVVGDGRARGRGSDTPRDPRFLLRHRGGTGLWQPVLKRQVAVLRATNKLDEAVAALNKYLETYMTDAEAWSELAELHLARQAYGPAHPKARRRGWRAYAPPHHTCAAVRAAAMTRPRSAWKSFSCWTRAIRTGSSSSRRCVAVRATAADTAVD